MTTTLVVPGLHGSEPEHWQTWFETRVRGCVRVHQADWRRPDLVTWAQPIRREIARAAGPVWIVAHSFGCLAAAQAGWDASERIAGAILVAPADPVHFGVADLIPGGDVGFPSIVVASRNDPWISFSRAAHLADRWGSDFLDLGRAGHINVAAGYGPWPGGLGIFELLRRGEKLLTGLHVAA